MVPSLGINWTNCINDRICLKKRGGGNHDITRTMVIEQSSYMRKNEIDFDILQCGIRGRY